MVLAGVILFGGMVMGASIADDSFTITTTVDGITELKILYDKVSAVDTFDSATSIATHNVTSTDTAPMFYAVVKTNEQILFDMVLKATSMKDKNNSNNTYEIKYSISPGANATFTGSITSTLAGATGTVYSYGGSSSSMQVIPVGLPLTVFTGPTVLNSLDNAAEGVYEGTVEISLVTI